VTCGPDPNLSQYPNTVEAAPSLGNAYGSTNTQTAKLGGTYEPEPSGLNSGPHSVTHDPAGITNESEIMLTKQETHISGQGENIDS